MLIENDQTTGSTRNLLNIAVPRDLKFEFCLQFLQRSPKEILHKVVDGEVFKVLRIDGETVLFSVKQGELGLAISFPGNQPSDKRVEEVVAYVREWFDLDTDLSGFYRIAQKDDLLGPLVKKFRGLRIMGHPDLFESLIWAVLGQQINLQFAYTLKQRFVEQFGERVVMNGCVYYLFPTPDRVAELSQSDLLPLQFSRQKAQYSINIAGAFLAGHISKEKLRGLTLESAKDALMKIKGVGNWTANYALMRSYRYPDAFPLEDAGLHNALKELLRMPKKPPLSRVKGIFRKYQGWEAYATVYLWKSL